jgi:hypothetical protein
MNLKNALNCCNSSKKVCESPLFWSIYNFYDLPFCLKWAHAKGKHLAKIKGLYALKFYFFANVCEFSKISYTYFVYDWCIRFTLRNVWFLYVMSIPLGSLVRCNDESKKLKLKLKLDSNRLHKTHYNLLPKQEFTTRVQHISKWLRC